MTTPDNSSIDDMLQRLRSVPPTRPNQLFSIDMTNNVPLRRPQNLQFKMNDRHDQHDEKLREIMKNSGKLKIGSERYNTSLQDMEHIEELGNGTCGHVVKMQHKPSGKIIAVKQMRRTGNMEENKRIVMDIEVVIKSHGCPYIVQCLGCFITEVEVWICMELMATCFDKLLKRLKKPIPERVLGKVTVATIKALSYLKDKHGIIHRDVKPSNILLDERGNVKLCDFGISGRLVDSMAATKSAGCTAYLAPERIEVDPRNPDYDIRADVWSLGITLVELATGMFPYKDCKTDFEVLAKVIDTDAPTLPEDQNFSPEFRSFVSACLIKDKNNRPKYVKLKEEPFYKNYESADVNVGEWFVNAMRDVEEEAKRLKVATSAIVSTNIAVVTTSTPSTRIESPPLTKIQSLPLNKIQSPPSTKIHSPPLNKIQSPPLTKVQSPPHSQPIVSTVTKHMRQHSEPPRSSFSTSPTTNYYTNGGDIAKPVISTHPLNMSTHQSRIALFQRAVSGDKPIRSYSPLVQRRAEMFENQVQQSRDRWNSPVGSPLPLRNHIDIDHQTPFASGNTSPIVLQRFYHQQKQHQEKKEAEELIKNEQCLGKKKLSSYIKLQLNGDRSGRSSRHQSPEPPPRLSRGLADSPLAIRRNFFESNATGSPAMSRRYISPTPPVPPPRRISESTSVPGSPQHVRARFHYTPEPQRRLYRNNDVI